MNKIIKTIYIFLTVLFVVPSIIYLVQHGTVFGFETYYNFFINENSNKILSTGLYLTLFISMTAIYVVFIKKESFKNIKELLIYTGIVSSIFLVMLPWTSSDIFYYMGVGELDAVYGQNPYYETMHKYYEKNSENVQDEILEQGAKGYWADTVVVYGPIAQLIFKILAALSFKNINICLLLFKLLNLIMHMFNCYLIYKITKKLKFSVLYGLNPFVFLEFIGNAHNDIIILFFMLLSIYFLKEKKQLMPSIIFLAIATGIKYFTILLLPALLLYYFKDEKTVSKKFLKCLGCGIIFLAIFALEYVLYFKDFSVMTSMGAQTKKYCKSLYSGLYSLGFINKDINKIANWNAIRVNLHGIVFILFAVIYEIFCMKMLVTKNDKFEKYMQGYNWTLVLFLLSLSSFQQWYLIWLMPTIVWQKDDITKDILIVLFASEVANSIYMFRQESWKYDYIFVLIILFIFIIWKAYSKMFPQSIREHEKNSN